MSVGDLTALQAQEEAAWEAYQTEAKKTRGLLDAYLAQSKKQHEKFEVWQKAENRASDARKAFVRSLGGGPQ